MIKKIFIMILILVLSGCGFKVAKKSNYEGLKISNIDISGEKRINFHLKNNIFSLVANESSGLVALEITTKKNRFIKEKNIKNEITKYQIILTSNINFKSTQQEKDVNFNVETRGDYLVGNNYSSTLNNEKRLIDNLVENLSEKIINQINIKLDDI